ncbi:MAG: hypothetical protein OXU83_00115 [Gammaproteobacteria bacterium]|nr:hypothetical protein [Gammaproteobacteria bacterium]
MNNPQVMNSLLEKEAMGGFNTKIGELESGGENQIAMWMLNTDYNGQNLYPKAGIFSNGWHQRQLVKSLRAEINENLIRACHRVVPLPFEAGEHGEAAVKIVDNRSVEGLRILEV